MAEKYFELAMVVFFVLLGFWRDDKDKERGEIYGIFVLLISAIIIMLVAGNWWDDYPGPTFFIYGLALYMIILAIIHAAEAGGPARGISQFKAMWNRARGRQVE